MSDVDQVTDFSDPGSEKLVAEQASDLYNIPAEAATIRARAAKDGISESLAAARLMTSGQMSKEEALTGLRYEQSQGRDVEADVVAEAAGPGGGIAGLDNVLENTGLPNIGSFSNGLTGIGDFSTKSNEPDGFIVKLQSRRNPGDVVYFKVMPTINESRGASYDPVTPAHHPGGIPVYKTTGVRTFDLNGKFVSRTIAEADEALRYTNLIRSWVMPYYGRGTAAHDKEALGAPPDVLLLSAFGKYHFSNIPVVMQNYNWSYPDDVDYIQSSRGAPIPIVWGVSVNLIEAYSPEEISAFDLAAFKNGDLTNAYNPSLYPLVTDSPTPTPEQSNPPPIPTASSFEKYTIKRDEPNIVSSVTGGGADGVGAYIGYRSPYKKNDPRRG